MPFYYHYKSSFCIIQSLNFTFSLEGYPSNAKLQDEVPNFSYNPNFNAQASSLSTFPVSLRRRLLNFPFVTAFSTSQLSLRLRLLNFPFVAAFSTSQLSLRRRLLSFPFVAAFSTIAAYSAITAVPTQQSPPCLLSVSAHPQSGTNLLRAFFFLEHLSSDDFAFVFCLKHISKVKEIINSLYEEYVVEETNKGTPHLSEPESFGSSSARRSQQNSVYNWDDFDDYCAKVEISETKRSELVDYLEKDRLKKNEIPKKFSCLEWWRMNRMQYPILSKIAADILAIPVSSVASEATFSAGTRVIDFYRSSLSPDTVQTLLCGGDGLRHIHGLKKKTKLKLIKKLFFQYLPLKIAV
ncbi:hypothetical protein ZIOFF_020888 [Zingiber officinale]|uniref:HAT C-terminal dimerisation domain-containing protein n=1 Tax=Zingiber officinale TaxID=94328 RepID=A0A8J5GZH8_ZINOF|nr:hypothetical protein ZIOFF_020888 [Zingiber officinale]